MRFLAACDRIVRDFSVHRRGHYDAARILSSRAATYLLLIRNTRSGSSRCNDEPIRPPSQSNLGA